MSPDGLLDLDRRIRLDRFELRHIAPGLAPDIGRGREADFIAAGYGGRPNPIGMESPSTQEAISPGSPAAGP